MYFVVDICCLCLSKNDITQNLINIDEKNETFHRKILSYFPELDFGETIDDYKLCTQCCNTINLLYEFKNKCFTSLNVFKSYRSNLSAISKANNDEFLPKNCNANYEINSTNTESNNDDNNVNSDIPNDTDDLDILNGNNIKEARVINDDEFSISGESKNSDITKTISEVLLSDLSDNALNLNSTNLQPDALYVKDESSKKFKCTVCQKKFLYYSALHKHIKSHKLIYNPTEETNTFNLEEKNVYNIEDEIINTQVSTTEIDKPYNCQICTRKFSQFSSLISHQRIHSSDQIEMSLKSPKKNTEEKIFRCKMCSKTFSKRKSLLDHKEVHTIEKPFECEICNVKFDSYTVLIKHRKTHL